MSGSGLRLKNQAPVVEAGPPPVPQGAVAQFPAVAPQARVASPSYQAVPQPAARTETNHLAHDWIQGIIGFLVVATILIGLQVWGRFDSDNTWWYTVATFMIGSLFLGVIVIKALLDNFAQGLILISIPTFIIISFMAVAKKVTMVSLGMWIVCSLAWFYYPYYIFVRMERSPVLKGIYAAILLAAILEWPILRDATFTGRAIENMLETMAQLRA